MPPHLSDDAGQPRPPDEVEALAAHFLAQLQAGENPDRQALLRAHPHLAGRLERRLALAEMVYRVGLAPQQDRPGAPETVPPPNLDDGPPATVVGPAEAADPPGLRQDLPGYEFLGKLGRGGMGVVYKAYQISLNRMVALKLLHAGVHADAEQRARFRIEAEILASLQHPNIVQVYEVGEHDGCPYMAMEYVAGGTLDDQLLGRPQPPRAAAELVETLARAMHCAHARGIVHRDLKPANILLQSKTTTDHTDDTDKKKPAIPSSVPSVLSVVDLFPKITDFGLAKRLAEGKGQTVTGAILGTPSYMAPEQASGRVHDVGPPTDVYALGALLYELLTGQPPFRGQTNVDTVRRVVSEEAPAPSRLCPKLPRDLETICLKCLEKQPAGRYATAQALADDLHRFLGGQPVAARPAGPGERAWKWARRRPAWAALVGVVVVAAVTTAGSFLWSYARVRGERDRARHNFQVARTAIDDLYTKMALERLFDEPQLDPLCQELLEKARALYEGLAQEQGANADARPDVALAWFRLGDIHRLQDHHAAAEHAYGEAIARQQALCRDYPGAPRYRQDLANSHNWLGEVLRERGHPAEEAERHYGAALGLQQGLVEEFPRAPAYRLELARSYYNLGIVRKDTNRLTEAQAGYDRAVELLTQLRTEDAGNPYYRQDLARALINRGVLHRLGNRPDQAGRDYDQAIGLLTVLRHEFHARAAYKFELAIARQDRGNLLWARGRNADARHEYQEALDLLRGLAADFSGRPGYKKKLGIALKNQGAALATAGDRAGAGQCWDQARGLFEALAQADPGTADYHGLLGMTLGQLGWLRTEEKNWPAARQLLEQGLAQLREALRPNPQHPDYRRELRDQYRDLAWTLLQLGDHAAAARAATAMAGVFPEQAQYRYYAACFLARCVPVAKDEQLAGRYIGQAVVLLREAAANAPPDLERIPDEPEVFRPLGAHPEFGPALRELDAKVRPRKAAS
jgi:tetratricopeptide (TPR) repeat protein